MALIEQLYTPINCLAWLSAGDKIEDDDTDQIYEIAEVVDQLWHLVRDQQITADLANLTIRNLRHPGAKASNRKDNPA